MILILLLPNIIYVQIISMISSAYKVLIILWMIKQLHKYNSLYLMTTILILLCNILSKRINYNLIIG